MKCPVCPNEELAAQELDGIAIDRCPRCHGFWIGEEGFRLAKDEQDENLVWHDLDLWKDATHYTVLEERGDCPSCDGKLHLIRHKSPTAPEGEAGVELDYCRNCRAVWLGEGELEQIVRSLEGELARMDSGDLLKAAVAEAVEVLNGPEPLAHEWQDLQRVLQLLKTRFLIEHPRFEKLIRGLGKLGGPLA